MEPQTKYLIHNIARRQEGRSKRIMMPRTPPINLILGGGQARVPRGRTLEVTESLVKRILPELIQKEAYGLLKVTNMSRQRVDLNSLTAVEPLPPPVPKPNPPMDSAANDSPHIGIYYPNLPGGKPLVADLKRPDLLPAPEAEDDLLDAAADDDVEITENS